MAHLCALKRTVEVSEVEVIAWHRVLCGYPIEIINRAMLELCLSETRFPEIGDLYQLCHRLWLKKNPAPYAPHGTGHDQSKPTLQAVKDIAARFDLQVD